MERKRQPANAPHYALKQRFKSSKTAVYIGDLIIGT